METTTGEEVEHCRLLSLDLVEFDLGLENKIELSILKTQCLVRVDIKLCHWVPKVPFVMRRIDFTIVYFYLNYEK